MIESREQYYTFLFIRICPGQDPLSRLRIAEIIGQVRRPGRYIEKLADLHRKVLLQFFSVPHADLTLEQINRGLVPLVQMSLGSGRRWKIHQMHADPCRPYAFRRNRTLINQCLFTQKVSGVRDDFAGQTRGRFHRAGFLAR